MRFLHSASLLPRQGLPLTAVHPKPFISLTLFSASVCCTHLELIVASVMLPRRQDSTASMSKRQTDSLAWLLVLMPRALLLGGVLQSRLQNLTAAIW